MKIRRFPESGYAEAWGWLLQSPAANFDDYGPTNFAAFKVDMQHRRAAGEFIEGVWDGADQLCGIIGWREMGMRWAMLHGICFDRRVHGTGLPYDAVAMVLDSIFNTGYIDKISAWYFADNARVHRFLEKLGAHAEGYLRRQTRRGGQPVDMRLVAFFKEDF